MTSSLTESSLPLHTMNQCDDKIPILYRGKFVDPITRQTYPDATAQNCSDRIQYPFQLDMDQEDSWCILAPAIVHQDKTAVLGSQDIITVASQYFTGSQNAGMYTRNKLRQSWDSILINAASRTLPKKFSKILLVYIAAQGGTNGSHCLTPRTDFSVDKMISPGYLENQFLDTIGPVVYVLEHCRIYFSVFLLIKLIIDLVDMIVRYMEIDKITSPTLGFSKTLLSASNKVFLTTVLTSMFNPRAPALAAVEHMEVGSCGQNGTH